MDTASPSSPHSAAGKFSESSPAGKKFIWLAFFLFALALRLFHLGTQNLWYDEQMTVEISQVDGQDFFHALRGESNKPPLYFLFMRCWPTKQATEFWIRLPGAIFGALTCLVALALGNQIFGGKRGWVFATLLALAPFHIYYSQEARMYSLLGLVGAMAMFCAWRFCQTQNRRWALAYLICATLSCYTFTYGIFLLPFSCLLSLCFRPCLSRKALLIIWGANILTMLLFCPWIPLLIDSAQSGVGLQLLSRGPVLLALAYTIFVLGLGTTFGPTTEQLRVLGKRILTEDPVTGGVLLGGLLLVILITLIGLKFLWRRNRNAFFFASLGLVIFCGGPALLNLLNPGVPFNARYAILALIPFLAAAAGFFWWATEKRLWRKALALLFVGCIAASLANLFFNPKYARDDMRSAARYLQSLETPPEHLIVCAGFMELSLRYYYDGPAKIFALNVRGAAVEKLFQPIASELADGQEFGLIYARPDHGDPNGVLPAWLLERYEFKARKSWTGVTLYLFGARQP